MSGLIAYGCGCSAGKTSQNLVMKFRAVAFRQTRTMSSRRNKRISHTSTNNRDSSGKDLWDILTSSPSNNNVTSREQMLDSTKKELFQPVTIAAKKSAGDDIGAELTGGEIKRDELLKLLREFYSQPKTQLLAAEHGLDMTIYKKSFESFRHYCVETEQLPVDFHIVLSDIMAGAGHVDDIFPYFLQHARQVYPHLECIDELRKISDLTEPSHWYPSARKLERKIIYHMGPTNSGKTYHALQRFYTAKSGVYCGPLRMLAVEVFNKCNNEAETPCDLVTGEDRRQANPDKPADHVACTVEMVSLTNHYDVAIIDEIQMLRDSTRGWAWTKALLGLNADEIHICGEGSAVDIVQEIVETCGDELELRKYERLTKLTILKEAVGSLKKIRPGDCIVCFSKNDIYSITPQLENLGYQTAVIYGGLPPGTKYAQAEKFNDPNDPCNVLVATDAIGMGLNLSIKRIIFFSLIKPTTDKDGSKQMEKITTSQALQIAGRAGRFGTQYEDGEVTTFRKDDLPLLKLILSGTVDPIEQAGLHPTAEQIELFAYHLPKATLSNLIDIFIHLCRLDHDRYFMCNMEDFKYLANVIEHVPLALRVRYTLCSAPISSQDTFTCNMFLKFARKYSTGLPITYDWLMEKMKAPFQPPKTLPDLVHLEQAFDVFDLYLWLGYRFPDMFPDMELVRDSQTELDYVIRESVAAITALLKGHKTTKVKIPITVASEKIYGRRGKRAEVSKADLIDKEGIPLIKELEDDRSKSLGRHLKDTAGLSVDLEDLVETEVEKQSDSRSDIIETKRFPDQFGDSKLEIKVENDLDRETEILNTVDGKVIDKGPNVDKSKDNKLENTEENDEDNKTDLLEETIRNMHVVPEQKYIERALGRFYRNSKGANTEANFDEIESAQTRDNFSRQFRKKIRQENNTAFIKTKGIDMFRMRDKNVKWNRNTRMPYLYSKKLTELFQSSQPFGERTASVDGNLANQSESEPMEETSLMKALIRNGLITEEMMAQLHKEWLEEQETTASDSNSSDNTSEKNKNASDIGKVGRDNGEKDSASGKSSSDSGKNVT